MHMDFPVFWAGHVCYLYGSLILGRQGHADSDLFEHDWWNVRTIATKLVWVLLWQPASSIALSSMWVGRWGPWTPKFLWLVSHVLILGHKYCSLGHRHLIQSFKASVQCTRMHYAAHYAAAVGMWVDIVSFRVVACGSWIVCLKVLGTFIKLIKPVLCVHDRHQNKCTFL